MDKYKNIIVMKVGPHNDMSLSEIITTKKDEETLHGVHFWGYSGVFCHPRKVQEFCKNSINKGIVPKLILIETKSTYNSDIGFINNYSEDGVNYEKFNGPVQLQGAQFSFVTKRLKKLNNFSISNYNVVGGKNDGKSLDTHLRFRVNKSFATIKHENLNDEGVEVLVAELVEPYAIWLKE
ncbi:MAG: hypothetical protein N4A47_00515 [Clostridia bacterium]|jgi:hypothetical protein|nr:hypothetical protein [Clostridia bacterium]